MSASDIDYFAPYPPLSEQITKHITYLDTIGRPKITLKYKELTDKHTGQIYVRPNRALPYFGVSHTRIHRLPIRCRSAHTCRSL